MFFSSFGYIRKVTIIRQDSEPNDNENITESHDEKNMIEQKIENKEKKRECN